MERQETTAVFGYEPMDSELPTIEVTKSVKKAIDSEMACLKAVAKFVTYSEADHTIVTSDGRIEPMANVDGILLGTEEFDERDLANRPHLKCISRIGTGIDNIRLPQRDIDRLVEVEDIWTPQAVAEYDMRTLYRWLDRPMQNGMSIHDITVGIVGASGRIGMELGTELNGKVKNILRNDTYGLSEPIDEVVGNCDILFIHIPSTTENRHYINKDFLSKCTCNTIVAPVRTNVVDFEGIRYFKGIDIVLDCELPKNRNGLECVYTTNHTATRVPYYYNRMIRQAALNCVAHIKNGRSR